MKQIIKAMLSGALIEAMIASETRTVKIKSYNDNGKFYVVTKDGGNKFQGLIELTDFVGYEFEHKELKTALSIGLVGDKSQRKQITLFVDENNEGYFKVSSSINQNSRLSRMVRNVFVTLPTNTEDEIPFKTMSIRLGNSESTVEIALKAKTEKKLLKKLIAVLEHIQKIDGRNMVTTYKSFLESK